MFWYFSDLNIYRKDVFQVEAIIRYGHATDSSSFNEMENMNTVEDKSVHLNVISKAF